MGPEVITALELPTRMRLALRLVERDYRILGGNDFAYHVWEGSLRKRYLSGPREAGFAVLADFDQNGWLDAAVLGASADTLRTIAILADADTVRTTVFRQRPFDPLKELGRVETYLVFVAPGAIPPAWSEVDSTVVRDRPAFAEVDFRARMIVHYFSTDGWRSISVTQ